MLDTWIRLSERNSRDQRRLAVGVKNYLVEGGSGSGKTSVCDELSRRGHHAIQGDRELAYQGDPITGEAVDGTSGVAVHHHHIWPVDRVRELIADQGEPATFFCGGSRNVEQFVDLFDAVFILDVDLDTLNRRLDARREGEWGGRPAERTLIQELHGTGEGLPSRGVLVDATAPLAQVVDEILRLAC